MSEIANNVVKIAKSQVGVEEATGQNDGIMVSRYQATVALGQGDQWCAAFCMWCLEKAGVTGWPVSGYVPTIWDWCENHGVLVDKPRVGAWVMYYDNKQPPPYHIGIVEEVYSNGHSYRSIEGNISNMVWNGDSTGKPCKFGLWDEVLSWDGTTPTLPSLEQTVKVFQHNNEEGVPVTGLVVANRNAAMKGITVNGEAVTSEDLAKLGISEVIIRYKNYKQ